MAVSACNNQYFTFSFTIISYNSIYCKIEAKLQKKRKQIWKRIKLEN